MQTLPQLLQSYGAYHTKRATLYSHFIGVPLVVFGIMIFTAWIKINVAPVFSLALVWPLVIVIGIYYIRLDWKIGLGLLAIFCLLAAIACWYTAAGVDAFSVWTFLICFIGGWIIQFVGHVFEGKKPAFLDNLWQMLAAPLFLAVELLHVLGYRQDLAR